LPGRQGVGGSDPPCSTSESEIKSRTAVLVGTAVFEPRAASEAVWSPRAAMGMKLGSRLSVRSGKQGGKNWCEKPVSEATWEYVQRL